MWFLLFAWIVLLGASAFFAKETLGLDPSQMSSLFSALSAPQRLAASAIVFAALSLIGSAIWRAHRHARQIRLLHARFKGIRDALIAHGSQHDFDAAVQHLFGSDPEEAISSLQKKLADTEQRATLQQSQNEAADMQVRLDGIRRRQQALRETIGGVAEERRAIEPVFGELRERQRQLERSLTELEIDDSKDHLADRLKELDHDVSLILARLNVLQDSLTTLNRFKGELGKSQAELVPLRAPELGINALIDDLRLRRDQLNITLDEIESNGDQKLSSRVEALSKSKLEIEQKVARFDKYFNILNAIRLDFEELKERQAHLERSLAEVETDSSGTSLADRQNALNEFVIQSRLRLRTLQDSMSTLNQFKEELAKSQVELVPLQAPVFGIEALIGEVHASRDQIIKALDDIELSRDEKLGSRVEALSKSKIEIEQKVARLDECFNILNAIRLDFEELKERQEHLERSLAEVETDSSGRSLADRQNALNEFVIQSRLRLRTLQDSLATLNQFKEELAKSQVELVPLQAPVFGIEALIGEVQASRDQIIKALDEIELGGDEKLGSRMEALSKSKLEIEGRIAQVFEHFTTLDSIRKDIGGIFTTIRNTLNRIG